MKGWKKITKTQRNGRDLHTTKTRKKHEGMQWMGRNTNNQRRTNKVRNIERKFKTFKGREGKKHGQPRPDKTENEIREDKEQPQVRRARNNTQNSTSTQRATHTYRYIFIDTM